MEVMLPNGSVINVRSEVWERWDIVYANVLNKSSDCDNDIITPDLTQNADFKLNITLKMKADVCNEQL